MKERPILFSGPMVRALLDGRKTVTRRVVQPQPNAGPKGRMVDLGSVFGLEDGCLSGEWPCPYGAPGDQLWVRETHAILDMRAEAAASAKPVRPKRFWRAGVSYKADDSDVYLTPNLIPETWRESFDNDHVIWRPSIFMPRWASRISLEITDVRVERLQAITDAECEAEGVRPSVDGKAGGRDWRFEETGWVRTYRQLWDELNGKRGYGWDTNPWVWVVRFKLVT